MGSGDSLPSTVTTWDSSSAQGSTYFPEDESSREEPRGTGKKVFADLLCLTLALHSPRKPPMLTHTHFLFTANERTSLFEAIHDALLWIIALCRFPQQRLQRCWG